MNQGSLSDDLLQELRELWSESFHCLLSTHSAKYEGYPFGSLLPICRDGRGNPLLLISHLAQHTRNLAANPRCALMLTKGSHTDVQQWARLTCLADAEPVSSSTAVERYCRYYPESRRYHKELNFHLYRLQPKQFYFIAGFGSARWFDVSRLLDQQSFPTAGEMELLFQLNAHEHGILHSYFANRGVSIGDEIHAVGADPWGIDIRAGEHLMRHHFTCPMADESAFMTYLKSADTG
jgi:heme iron utilization protein